MKKNDVSATKISVSALVRFTPEELIKRGYTIHQLKDAGFTNHFLKDLKKKEKSKK